MRRGARAGALVETLDIAATILTHLGLPLPSPGQSRPLQPLLTDPSREHRDAVFSYVDDRAMTRTDRWKLALYGDGDGELYDLDDDSGEVRNLYHDPEYAGIRGEQAARYAEETLATQRVRGMLTRCPPDRDRERAFEEIRAAGAAQ